MKRDLQGYAKVEAGEMYKFPRTLQEAFGPHCRTHIEEDLQSQHWSLSDLIGASVLFALAAFIAGIVAARWIL